VVVRRAAEQKMLCLISRCSISSGAGIQRSVPSGGRQGDVNGRGLALGVRQDNNDPHHRRAKISRTGILNATARSRGRRLVVGVKMRMEAAVEYKRARMGEAKHECPRSSPVAVGALQQLIRAVMARRVEEVVAHDGVIIRISIDPPYGVSRVNGHREGCKSIL
jgi:hypothetical protein